MRVEDFCFFANRRRHTSFTSDWSADVCSSDLNYDEVKFASEKFVNKLNDLDGVSFIFSPNLDKIGRESCRERV